MSIYNEESYENKILECLISNNYGLTVAGISKIIGSSRNTIYRYLGILEGRDVVFKKAIGNYNLYFSKEGRQVSRDVVSSFYKGLLLAFSTEIKDLANFKQFGKMMASSVELPFDLISSNEIKTSHEPLKKEFLEILGVIRPYISLLHDKIMLKDIIVNEQQQELVIHFINSDMLEESMAGIYHFYLLTGFIEEKIITKFNINVSCDVLEYKMSNKNEPNFIKFTLKLL